MTLKAGSPSEAALYHMRGNVFLMRGMIIWLAAMLLAALMLCTASAEAANYYVRQGATGSGNGSDWTNAYASLPATLQRGATYYIADGSYGSYTFDDAVSGTSLITIKKATIDDHGDAPGWQNTYGDGQAIFKSWVMSASYYYIDGGSTTGYGFSIVNPTAADAAVHLNGNLTNITIKSLSIDCTGAPITTRNVRVYCASSCSNLLFSNIETKKSGNDCFAIFNVRDSVFEHLYLHSKVLTEQHGDGFEIGGGNNVHIRYSKFSWNDQIIFWRGDFTSGSYHIYGNIFYNQPGSGKGIHSQSGDPVVGPLYVYNNTFYNVYYAINVLSKTNGSFKNNLIYSTTTGNSYGSVTHNFNASSSSLNEANGQSVSSNPFVNAAGLNFRLNKATQPGDSSIGATYNKDMFGNIRGADGVWDRGAIEYDSGEPPKELPPPALM